MLFNNYKIELKHMKLKLNKLNNRDNKSLLHVKCNINP